MIFQDTVRWFFRWPCDDKIAMILPFPTAKCKIIGSDFYQIFETLDGTHCHNTHTKFLYPVSHIFIHSLHKFYFYSQGFCCSFIFPFLYWLFSQLIFINLFISYAILWTDLISINVGFYLGRINFRLKRTSSNGSSATLSNNLIKLQKCSCFHFNVNFLGALLRFWLIIKSSPIEASGIWNFHFPKFHEPFLSFFWVWQ